ncbi:hypothetical protein H9638_04570 [Arthrobacter sp. Sa2BUA2]|uniref:DUF732 domain-containing protein n=1 Tax=Arthrobacter pullicola TaxID=2762224 RepID=A0ABR8YFU0_9MICC|nr:hypothetical protein [Arthrobacter pullicola]MBD8043082.1 hypothetical protein [Arthrobacter pullicola]
MKSGLKPPSRSRRVPGLLLVPLLTLGLASGCSFTEPATDTAPAASPSPSASSSGSGKAKPSKSSSASASPVEGGAETQEDAEAVVQSPQPAPEPEFDAAQEQFLQDKVPEGNDPNAILQVGQEHCDQLTSANALDGEAVLSELIMKPSKDTSDAIVSLCPGLLPVLEAAALGFPDGVFAVGEAAPWAEEPSVAPGTYRAYGMSTECGISVYAGSGDLIGSFDGTQPVTVGADAARVESTQCYSWSRA